MNSFPTTFEQNVSIDFISYVFNRGKLGHSRFHKAISNSLLEM